MKRILIVMPNWIGDAVMAQPLLALLKRFHPEAMIDALAPTWVSPILRFMPEINQIYETTLAHGKLQLLQRWKLAQQFKQTQYHAAYILPNSFKSALIPWLAHIPLRVGYKGEARYLLLNVIHHPPTQHQRTMLMHYAKLAYQPHAVIENFASEIPLPQLQITETAQTEQAFGLNTQRPLLVLSPGAEYGDAKRWPPHHFTNLANLVAQSFPYMQIVALGSQKDAAVAEAILKQAPHVKNLCGKTSLTQASALIARADAVICNDSGLMHIAAALNHKIIALFGSTDPRHTPPLTQNATILWLHLSCSPCFKRSCPLGHHQCMENIQPEEVFTHLRSMLTR